MKKILLSLGTVMLSFTVSHAQTFNFGGKLEGNDDTDSEVTRIISNSGYFYVIGSFSDSLQLDLMGTEGPGGYVIHEATGGLQSAFIAKYDESGDLHWAFALGDGTTGAVELKDIAVDGWYNQVIVGGNYALTVDFNPLAAPHINTSTVGQDPFFAVYDASTGELVSGNQAYTLPTDQPSSSITGVSIDYNNNICVTGYYAGQMDYNPDAGIDAFVNSNMGSFDAFVAKYDKTDLNVPVFYHNIAGTTGGDEKALHIVCDNDGGVLVSGTFTTNIQLDWDFGLLNKISNGMNDIFQVRADYTGNFMSGMSIGGTGNDLPKGISSTDGFSYDMVLLSEFENTVNLNPAGTANVTSAGGTDVAVARYSLDGTYKHGKRLGNSLANAAKFIVKAPSGGGAKKGARSTEGNFYIGMSYSGTLDVNPNAAITENITTSNTSINSAIIEFDTLLNKITHLTIEAQNTNTMSFNDYSSSNNIALGGSFNGTAVDVMPYATVMGYTHTTQNAGFISYFNECHMTAEVIMPFAYECGSCTASLTIQATGAIDGIGEVEWAGGVYDYGLVISNLCPGYYYAQVFDGHGCEYYTDDFYIYDHDTIPTATVLTSPSSCNTDLGSASVTVTNADGPYTIIWSSGDTTAVTDSLAAGVYTVKVQDTLGCFVQETFSINDSDGPVITVNTTSNPTCSGGNGSIDVTITGGVAPLTFQWSNGATTEDLINVPEGTYALIVKDANGCQSQVCVSLTSPEPIHLASFSFIAPSFCGANDGTYGLEIAGGTEPYTYLWDAAAGSQTTDSALALSAGLYSVTVTDNNGCSALIQVPLSDQSGPYYSWWDLYTQSPLCGGPTGYIENTIWGVTPISFIWEDGITNSEDRYDIEEGGTFYQVATDAVGCKQVFTYTLDQQLPNTPDICMVTVDETGTQNVVIWDESTTPEAVSYNIYREGFCSSTDFLPIGNVSSDSLSLFYDTVVNTETKSWQYYVTAIDSCGYESLPSEINKTILLTSAFNAAEDIELNWEAYIGRVISQYDIYRVDPVDSTIYTKIDSVSGTTLAYTDTDDFTAYSGKDIEYYVEAIPENPCYASRAFNQNASRSNHTRLSFGVIDTTSAVNDIPAIEDLVKVFPNPAHDRLNIQVSGSQVYTAVLMNNMGQSIKSFEMNRSAVISTTSLPQGVYYLKMTSSDQKTKVYKVVVAH